VIVTVKQILNFQVQEPNVDRSLQTSIGTNGADLDAIAGSANVFANNNNRSVEAVQAQSLAQIQAVYALTFSVDHNQVRGKSCDLSHAISSTLGFDNAVSGPNLGTEERPTFWRKDSQHFSANALGSGYDFNRRQLCQSIVILKLKIDLDRSA
jgi:hypothetical protein